MIGLLGSGDFVDEDEDYDRAIFCAKDVEAHKGQLFRQEGEFGNSFVTNPFNRKRGKVVEEGSIGLDSMSTVDIFADRNMLKNVWFTRKTKHITCNAGTVVVRQKGGLPRYSTVWYHENAICEHTVPQQSPKMFPSDARQRSRQPDHCALR